MQDGSSVERSRGSALLRSKLRRPVVPDYFVPRPRLDEALATATSRPLTLVIAPAGSGKTQLLSSWASATTHPVAWLSLEEMDDDPVGLWTGMIAALETVVPDVGVTARERVMAQAPISVVVETLLDALDGAGPDPWVLVVDDVHHIKDPSAADSLALFARLLPTWLHLVIAGRTDPPFPLDRWRVGGRVAEIRFPELRFNDAEAKEVLARLAPELSDDELEASARHADGWAAGVQMTALATRSAHTQLAPVALPPDIHVLAEDYVWHEVLAAGDPEVVDLLVQLSVVDRFNVNLANAIADRQDTRMLLLRGESQGLFVHRLGTDDWFRIHPLVREALHHQLSRSSRHRDCHARAARWFEDAGETVDALDQWLLADRPREALRLLGARSTELYDLGRESVITRALAAIPREAAAADVPALIDFAVSHILGPREQFLEVVQEVAWHADRADQDYSPQLHGLQAIALTMAGDWTNGAASARRALDGLGAAWWGDPAGRFAWNTIGRDVALSERWDDKDELVRDTTLAMSRDPRRGIALEGVRAVGHAFAGRPVEALQVAAGVRHAAPTMSILRVELALAEAIARLELGDRERALVELRVLADEPTEPRLFSPVKAMLTLAVAAVDDGDGAAAAREIERAASLVSAARGGPDLREWLRRDATTVAIASGDLDDADQSARAILDRFWGPASRAQVAIATGDVAGAVDELAHAVPRCPRHEVVLGLLLGRASTVPDEVLGYVAPAVETASVHGMLQTVVSNGRQLMDVIERAAWRLPEEWLHRLRLAMAPARIPVFQPTREFPEVLTDRERDVLRLLPSRLTLGEIAKELYVSVNTVKFHLRVIYRKLGVNSREEAAAIARATSRTAVSTTPVARHGGPVRTPS